MMPQDRPLKGLKAAVELARKAIADAVEASRLVESDSAVQIKGEMMRQQQMWPKLEHFGDLEELLAAEAHDFQAAMAEAQNG